MTQAERDAPEFETEGSVLARRLRRLGLRRVQPPMLVWVLLCWTGSIAAILVLFWPGALASVVAAPQGSADGLVGADPPAWYRGLLLLSGAVLTATAVMVRRTPVPEPRPSSAVLAEFTIAVALAAPVLVLLADRSWWFAAVAAGLAAASEAIRRGPRVLPALLGASTWLVVLAHQFTPEGGRPGSWVWIALLGLAAAIAAFGTYYGVARAAESRTRLVRSLFRRSLHPGIVLVVVVLAIAVVVLRMTVLRGLFPEPDPVLWSPWNRLPVSWALAALVAGVIVWIAIRSSRDSLLRVGQRRVTAGLAVLGNLHLVFQGFLVVLGLVLAIFGAVDVPEHWMPAIAWCKVGGVVLLGLLMLLPPLRGTAARWLGIVAALFLIPNTLDTALQESAPDLFAPTPVQVTVLLIAAAAVLAVANLVRPTVRGSLIVRFAVVPLIAVHAGWLLPAVWTQFGLIVAVVTMVVALLLLQPPAARDNVTHSVRILTAAGTQLFGLAIALLAAPSLLDDPSLIVLGLVWLSVVVVAALCFETRAPDPGRVYTNGVRSPATVADGSLSA